MYNKDNLSELEEYSSAVTLSDMEIFIFPEILYALVLANIMSPDLWKWRKHPWFAKIDKMSDYRKILRVKQFIMDNFIFNLDLDTWGLTTKAKELNRFSSYIDLDILAQSNALFGYEGDKYYFDINIRQHFGLDKYTSDTIPYWKTETLEAMEAFKYKEGYGSGAGECVSFSSLYAAALFVVAKIPLEKIFLLATPLHSQNFIMVRDGILTNNRRIVTKKMWFNGSEISSKARRAIENEKITMVMNNEGFVHTMYGDYTLPDTTYGKFKKELEQFLTADITYEIFINFLRTHFEFHKYFQLVHNCCGKPAYIEIEKAFHYEHSAKVSLGESKQSELFHEIDVDEFYKSRLDNRVVLNNFCHFFSAKSIPVEEKSTRKKIEEFLSVLGENKASEITNSILNFASVKPKLPTPKGEKIKFDKIDISNANSSEDVVSYLSSIKSDNRVAALAFTAFRDMRYSEWKPFIKAALERNPVSITQCSELSLNELYEKLAGMDNYSIYSSKFRFAQPDEVWNYQRGDGIEKAILFINVINSREKGDAVFFRCDGKTVTVEIFGNSYEFITSKKNAPTQEDFS